MPGQRISDLPAGTPPYSPASLLELSVSIGAGAFDTRKALVSDLIPVIGVGGNVGIGTSSPQAKLDITTTTPDASLYLHSSATGVTGTDGLQLYIDASAASLWNYENTPLVFATNRIARIWIAADGSVGIGTNAPGTKFQIDGTSSSYGGGIPNGIMFLQAAGSSGQGVLHGVASTGSSATSYAWVQSLLANVAPSSYVLNPSGGNVGIGTTTPGCKLEVVGEIRASGVAGSLSFYDHDSTNDFTALYRNGNITYFYESTTSTNVMSLLANGSVGIGTQTPQTTLSVGPDNFGGDGIAGGSLLSVTRQIAASYTGIVVQNPYHSTLYLRAYGSSNALGPTTVIGTNGENIEFTPNSATPDANSVKLFIGLSGIGVGTRNPHSGLAVKNGIQLADTASIAHNLYYSGGWVYEVTGPGSVIGNYGNGFTIFSVGSGTGGSSAAALASVASFSPNSGVSIGAQFSSSSAPPVNGLLVQGVTSKPGGGIWADSSDIRTKEDINDYPRGLDEITKLRPISYRKNGKGGTIRDGVTYIGLIANEARQVMPEMVGVTQAKFDPEDDHLTEILTLDATAVIYALVNSVKELKAELDELKASRG